MKSLQEPDTNSRIMELSWFDVLMQGTGISSLVLYLMFLQSKLKFYLQTLNNDESSYPDKYDDLMITFLIGKYMASLWIFFSWMKGFEGHCC